MSVTTARPSLNRDEMVAARNCNTASNTSAVTPSANDTWELSKIVARVEPTATVTTKSNALSLASVRLPVSRSMTIKAT